MVYCIDASWRVYFHVEANNIEDARKKIKEAHMGEKYDYIDDEESLRINSIEPGCLVTAEIYLPKN